MSRTLATAPPFEREVVTFLEEWPGKWTDSPLDDEDTNSLREKAILRLLDAAALEARVAFSLAFTPTSPTNGAPKSESVTLVFRISGKEWPAALRESLPQFTPTHWWDGSNPLGTFQLRSAGRSKLRVSDLGEQAKATVLGNCPFFGENVLGYLLKGNCERWEPDFKAEPDDTAALNPKRGKETETATIDRFHRQIAKTLNAALNTPPLQAGDSESDIDAILGWKLSETPKKFTKGDPFPYEYGSDLHWLWGWGQRVETLLKDDTKLGQDDWRRFRACRQSRQAMMRFSVPFPLVIKPIEDALDWTEQRFAEFLRTKRHGDYLTGLHKLRERITTAVEIIAAQQGEKPQPKIVTPKPNRMKTPMAEMYARRLKESDPKFVFGTHLDWGKAIAAEASRDTSLAWTCSGSTAQNTDLWDEEMEQQGRSRKGRSVKASGLSAKRGATIGESDDVLSDIAAEQEQPAVDAILESGMGDKEKAETIRKVQDGSLSVPNAIGIAKKYPKRKSPVPNRR